MMLTTLCALTLLACWDRPLPTGTGTPEGSGEPVFGRLISEQSCTIDAVGGVVLCKPSAPAGDPAGPRSALLGTAEQVRYIRMASRYDTLSTPAVLEQDWVIENLLPEAIGTADGTTVTGFKVLVADGPRVTAYHAPGDTGTVRIINADGYGNYTDPDQPYWFSPEVVAPGDTSSVMMWRFEFPRTVKSASFKLWVFAMVPSDTPVPAQAPDHRPAWFSDPQYSSLCRGIMTDTCLRNVAVVEFTPTSTREERQAAADRVAGKVVGGDGVAYYLEVADDSTLVVLRAALATLQSLPQVRYADAFSTAPITFEQSHDHLRSHDEPGWRQWRNSPDSADGRNWAPEKIAAPFAWGCRVGDGARAVAVVDNGFHAVSDLAGNVDLTNSVGWNLYAGQPLVDHGTRVASIVAGRGNDSTQTSGVMWRASLRVYDMAVDSTGASGVPSADNMFRHIHTAGMAGARVINVSAGHVWKDSLGNPRNPAAATDTTQQRLDRGLVEMWYRAFRRRIHHLAAAGKRPLIVFSAGNQAIDARWNVARTAVDSAAYRDQVLVVGASDVHDNFASFSNTGAVVEVAAPGDGVFVLHGSALVDSVDASRPAGTTHTGTGTSFAAPHVTGVAGLLASFDSTLTAAQIKALILKGARRGGRSAGGIPILNAHEALKAAAERAGAPLCGNPVYRDTLGNVYTRRDSAWTTPELLFAATDTVLSPLHGGQVIGFGSSGGRQWSAGAWNAVATVSDTTGSAAHRTRTARSHAGDSVFTVVKSSGADPRRDEVYDIYLNGAHWHRLDNGSYPALPRVDLAPTTASRCVQWPTLVNGSPNNEFGVCYQSWPVYDRITSTHTLAFSSPRGELILPIALERDQRSVNLSEFLHGGDWHRIHESLTGAIETHVLFIDVRTKTVRSIPRNGQEASRIAVSEDGNTLVMRRVFRSNNVVFNVTVGTKTWSQLACEVSYQQITDTPSSFSFRQRFFVDGGRRGNCLPGATFAS